MFSMSDGWTSAAKETMERWLDVIRIPFSGVFVFFWNEAKRSVVFGSVG
jgi:hypothetical protein